MNRRHKMEGIKHIELTRNTETGEVECKSGGAVTEGMLSAIAALDLCREGRYYEGLGGCIESEVLPLKWYCVVVK